MFSSLVPVTSGPVFWPLLWVRPDCAQPITGHVTEVTCPVIGQAQPEVTPTKRQKTDPGNSIKNVISEHMLQIAVHEHFLRNCLKVNVIEQLWW